MNSLRLAVLALFVLCSHSTRAQWRVLYKSQDIIQSANTATQADTVNPITKIEPRGKLSKYLIVRYAHSKRQLLAKNTVWGFTDSTNAIWRYYGNDLCRLLSYNGFWAEYAIYRTRFGRSSNPAVYYEPGYSRTLDSKVEVTWRKAMNDVPPGHILR